MTLRDNKYFNALDVKTGHLWTMYQSVMESPIIFESNFGMIVCTYFNFVSIKLSKLLSPI